MSAEKALVEACSKFGVSYDSFYQKFDNAYDEPHRFFHTRDHRDYVVERVYRMAKVYCLDDMARAVLVMAAYFHDIVYDPKSSSNERDSAKLFFDFANLNVDMNLLSSQVYEVVNLIADTKDHELSDSSSNEKKILIAADMAVVAEAKSFSSLLKYEDQIFKEYSFVDYEIYKSTRIYLLEKWAKQYNNSLLKSLAEYVASHRPTIGIYAGSFSPFHIGHLNILYKATAMFDKVIVAQGQNPEKDIPNPIQDVKTLNYFQVESYNGLLTDFIKSKENVCNPVLIRGLRNGYDLEYESNQLSFMKDLYDDLSVVMIACDPWLGHISSTALKSLSKFDKSLYDNYRVL